MNSYGVDQYARGVREIKGHRFAICDECGILTRSGYGFEISLSTYDYGISTRASLCRGCATKRLARLWLEAETVCAKLRG